MAIEEVLSGTITNRDAIPIAFSAGNLAAGTAKIAVGTVEIGVFDAGSTYRMFEIPSNAIVHRVEISCDVGIVAAIANVGIYQTTNNGGAVVDADHFGSAVDLDAAALTDSSIMHESAVVGIEDVEKELWSALGLSADSNRGYDVVITTTVAATTGGTVSLRAWYTTNQ